MLTRLSRTFVVSVALTCAGASLAAAQEKVVVGLPGAGWSVQYAYYQFGEKLGFFKDEGLALERIAVSGSAVLLPQVASNQVQFGYANPDLTVIALAKGEPLPLKFVQNWLQSSTWEVVTLAGSPIKTLADLKGKKLGVGALTFGNIPLTKSMLTNAGLGWNRDVEILPVGTGAAAWRRLQTGEIDALNLFVGEHGRMELAGIAITRMPLPEQFRTIFSNGMVTSDTLIAQKPKVVAGFGRALVKSWIACKANTEACVRAYWDQNPAAKPSADKEASQLAIDMKQVMFDGKTIDDFSSNPARKYGLYPDAAWKGLIGVMHTEGQITRADLDLTKLFTNQFVDEFNKFDADAVVKAAQAAK